MQQEDDLRGLAKVMEFIVIGNFVSSKIGKVKST